MFVLVNNWRVFQNGNFVFSRVGEKSLIHVRVAARIYENDVRIAARAYQKDVDENIEQRMGSWYSVGENAWMDEWSDEIRWDNK